MAKIIIPNSLEQSTVMMIHNIVKQVRDIAVHMKSIERQLDFVLDELDKVRKN